MPYTIGPTETIYRDELLRKLTSDYTKTFGVMFQHFKKDGTYEFFHDIEYADRHIHDGDNIRISDGAYGHMYTYEKYTPRDRLMLWGAAVRHGVKRWPDGIPRETEEGGTAADEGGTAADEGGTAADEGGTAADEDTKGKRKTKRSSKKRRTRKVKTRKSKKRRTGKNKKRKSKTRRN